MLFLSLGAKAQVTGVVIDSKTRQPIDYVNVYYEGTTTGGQTDSKGRFSIKEDDRWNELTVSTMGYVTQKVRLVPGKKKRQQAFVRLVHDAVDGVAHIVERPRRDEEIVKKHHHPFFEVWPSRALHTFPSRQSNQP